MTDAAMWRGRHVVVSGGTGALGSAVVAHLIEAGAACVLACRDTAQAERSAHHGNPQVRFVATGDLASEEGVARLFADVPHLWASLHLAGGFSARPVAQTSMDDITAAMRTNFVSAFLCSRAAIAALRPHREGRIVNVAARPALEWRAGAGMAAYAASKAAVAAMTVALAEEVAKESILVNAVAPSILDTPGNRHAMPKADHASWPTVDEVARTILFLASPDNRVTRGAVVPVYGRA